MQDLAGELGADAISFYPLQARTLIPLRYLLSSVMTVGALVMRHPRAVVVQNPPVFPGLIVWLWASLTRGRMVLDSHPTSFGAKGNRQGRAMLGVTRFLARKSRGVLVTNREYAELVDTWGGHGIVLHEAPPAVAEEQETEPNTVLFVCTFDPDDPVAEVFEAARQLPGLRFLVTGDPGRMDTALGAAVPANVELLGWLDLPRFQALMGRSQVVLALTTEQGSVMRAAYEAVFAEKPLVTSDVGMVAGLFPASELVDNTVDGIVSGLQRAVYSPPSPGALAEQAAAATARWRAQKAELLAALGEVASPEAHEVERSDV